nr:hypothetical protein [Rhodococcus sp. (in: high G+C Gram-positive bacteria)]
MTIVHITEIDEDGNVKLSVPGEAFYADHQSSLFDGYHKMRATMHGILEHFLVEPGHAVVIEAARELNILMAYRRVEKACEKVLDAMRAQKVSIEDLMNVRMAAQIAIEDINKELAGQ